MNLNELEALAILSTIPYLGSVKIRQLIERFGSAAESLKASSETIESLPGFGKKIADAWDTYKKQTLWQQDFKLADHYGVELIPYSSSRFPKPLLEIKDPPVLLYVKGELKNIDQQSIAIVGTRNAGIYGLEMAALLAEELAAQNFTVISGLARGIDTAAHRGALRRGRTLGIIGSGIADLYPKENLSLAEEIAKNGAIVSEYPMRTPPDRHTFPRRNRLVSGLSLGIVLIEAPLKSGAMITMDLALKQNKKLFALPGRVDHDNFRGNHALIKCGKAALIENATDITQSFENLFGKIEPLRPVSSQKAVILDAEEEFLIRQFPQEELSFEDLAIKTKLPVAKLNALITGLTLKKMIQEYPGKIYKKCRM